MRFINYGLGYLQKDMTVGKLYTIDQYGALIDDAGDMRNSDNFVMEPEVVSVEDDTVNPKAKFGSAKANFSGVPAIADIALGSVMGGGAYKYGMYNFRDSNIAASTYHDAIKRHMLLWFDGEDNDPTEGTIPGSGESHLAHVMACCTLLLDAQATGRLDDDRSKTGLVRQQLDKAAANLHNFKVAYDKT
jgi:hypothetical protein